jgi:hypothetical protein
LKCLHGLIIALLGQLITAIFHTFEGMGSPEVSHCYTGDNANNMSASAKCSDRIDTE